MGFNCFGHGVLIILLLAMAGSLVQGQGTRVGFYLRSCPRAESIVRSAVQSHFRSDPPLAPGWLRMHFHDCFVNGCDASIVIYGAGTEKTAPPNILLRGYKVIDDAKTDETYRLYNFTTTGNGADPSIAPAFVSQLQALCPRNGDGSRRIGREYWSPTKGYVRMLPPRTLFNDSWALEGYLD
ncbi:hypothetical protein V6N13_102650 [Hibiscus sabdariffa]|uniref:peroxidase n=1 Tax=Hibiscus sabdariffa TaxID=183260 RepID=A0ABR2D7F6_9ROSI